MADELLPVRIISPEELRDIFNELQLWDLVQTGLLHSFVFHSGNPNPDFHQPLGTLSQGVRYYNDWMDEVAVVHQYVLPDGSIGASGRPDPKRVIEGGVIYSVPPRRR